MIRAQSRAGPPNSCFFLPKSDTRAPPELSCLQSAAMMDPALVMRERTKERGV